MNAPVAILWMGGLCLSSAIALLSACTAAPVGAAAARRLPAAAQVAVATPQGPLRFSRPVVLLGEVHDNAHQHALRLQALEALVAQGGRPALLMEQFDRGRQPQIDQARAAHPGADAAAVDAVVAAGAPGPSGWDWRLYKPYVALALRQGLPLVAVNVSRGEARQIMRDGLAAHGFDAQVPSDLLAGQASGIVQSHCGLVDQAMAQRMALAQVARDQAMARAVEQHAAGGAVLLAGNGHVQRDLGVPRWLSAGTLGRTEAIGLLERDAVDGAVDGAGFDRVVPTAAQARPDPCAGVQMPAAAPPAGQPANTRRQP